MLSVFHILMAYVEINIYETFEFTFPKEDLQLKNLKFF